MRLLLDGSDAIAYGALHAGCTFFAGYPITPASSILHRMMELLPPAGGVAVQGEDEIASIGFCIGAAMAGERAMTATSGPGMSLYSENLGLAVMGEVPLVIVDVQRMGPATGGATTTAEGDVQFARWGTSGGYPIPVYAATGPADAYRLTIEAFHTAERLRTPVILLSSKDLALTTETADLADFVRPNVAPRDRELFSRFTGSIHDERHILTSDPEKIRRKLEHLNRKIEGLELVRARMVPGCDTLVIAYGIAARAAMRTRASLLVLYSLWPVPEEAIRAALHGVRRVIVPELNDGQYAREIERLAGDREVVRVNRIDGRLLEPIA